jgi:uracil-DNA glycosylase
MPTVCRDGARPVAPSPGHVRRQNTFTGRLTPAMLDGILSRAKQIAGLD